MGGVKRVCASLLLIRNVSLRFRKEAHLWLKLARKQRLLTQRLQSRNSKLAHSPSHNLFDPVQTRLCADQILLRRDTERPALHPWIGPPPMS